VHDTAIHLDNLTKVYQTGKGSLTVLDHVNLTVGPTEAVALIGASGAGKSTLLSLIAGLDRPTSGTATVAGLELGAATPQQLAAFRFQRLGLIFQQHHLIPTLTALENVMLPCSPWRVDYNPRERAQELLGEVGLADRAHHLPAQLSGGEQQRVCIARALINQPQVLLADEPTGNLDEESAELVITLIRRLAAERQMALLLVTHDLALAHSLPRVLRLKAGALVD
jgi:putative ABC transport system ATP-binding protein